MSGVWALLACVLFGHQHVHWQATGLDEKDDWLFRWCRRCGATQTARTSEVNRG